MDMNLYALEALAQQQLAERWAEAEVSRRLRAAEPPPRPLRVTLGLALIRVGIWTLGPAHRRLVPRAS